MDNLFRVLCFNVFLNYKMNTHGIYRIGFQSVRFNQCEGWRALLIPIYWLSRTIYKQLYTDVCQSYRWFSANICFWYTTDGNMMLYFLNCENDSQMCIGSTIMDMPFILKSYKNSIEREHLCKMTDTRSYGMMCADSYLLIIITIFDVSFTRM